MEWLPGEIMVLTLHRWAGFQHKRNLDFKFLSFWIKGDGKAWFCIEFQFELRLGHWVFMCTTRYSYRFLSLPLSIRANWCASPIKLRGNLRGVRILFNFSNTFSPLLPEEAVFDRGKHLNRVQSSQFYPLISFYIPRRKASVIAVNQITVPSLTSAGFLK